MLTDKLFSTAKSLILKLISFLLINISQSDNHFQLIAITNDFYAYERVATISTKSAAAKLFSCVNLLNQQLRSPSPAVNLAHLLLVSNS